MDNRNVYQQTQPQNGFYSYVYPTAATAYARPDAIPYILPQAAPPAVLKGRPVSSFEEARVAQIDLDGSLSIFPDLGNQKIYTKRINPDGTAAFQTYILDTQVAPSESVAQEYVTQTEFAELKASLDAILAKIAEPKTAKQNPPLNF